ncbi:MAG: GNAT family N-acyltransferase [Acidobacteriota bacterium]
MTHAPDDDRTAHVLPDVATAAADDPAYPTFPAQVPTVELREGRYAVRYARHLRELDDILRLRFDVFNLELGEGLDSAFETGRDIDAFDGVCHHLLVVDVEDDDRIVGTYRLQTGDMARRHRGFYSATEFDLSGLLDAAGDDAIEVGRACVHRDHRNTQVLFLLWRGLAQYMLHNRKRYLFGCCSLTSQNVAEGRAVMAHLEKRGLVHPTLRVEPLPACRCYDGAPPIDPSIKVHIPKLFRTYLRHGALVCGPPAIDRLFKTIDYLVVFDVQAMDERQVRTFFGERRRRSKRADAGSPSDPPGDARRDSA